jgi:hypothetical protein
LSATLQKGVARLRANVAALDATYDAVVHVRPATVSAKWDSDIARLREQRLVTRRPTRNEVEVWAAKVRRMFSPPPYSATVRERFRAELARAA